MQLAFPYSRFVGFRSSRDSSRGRSSHVQRRRQWKPAAAERKVFKEHEHLACYLQWRRFTAVDACSASWEIYSGIKLI